MGNGCPLLAMKKVNKAGYSDPGGGAAGFYSSLQSGAGSDLRHHGLKIIPLASRQKRNPAGVVASEDRSEYLYVPTLNDSDRL